MNWMGYSLGLGWRDGISRSNNKCYSDSSPVVSRLLQIRSLRLTNDGVREHVLGLSTTGVHTEKHYWNHVDVDECSFYLQ